MERPRPLADAVVTLICEIDSLITRNKRSQELDEYRRGYQEALTGLKNDVPMIDVVDALKALGWQPPRPHWVAPPPDATASEPQP